MGWLHPYIAYTCPSHLVFLWIVFFGELLVVFLFSCSLVLFHSFLFIFSHLILDYTMSAKKQVEALLSEAAGSTAASTRAKLTAAIQEIQTMLSATKSSVYDLCVNIERAKSRVEVKRAFKEFNDVMRILLEAAPTDRHDTLVRDYLWSLKLSKRLRKTLLSTSPVTVALLQ